MKTIYFSLLALCISLVLFCSCNRQEELASENDDISQLVIKTALNPIPGSLRHGPLSDFPEDSRIGLFITKGNLGDDYSPDMSRNILSTLSTGIWKQNPAVNLYAHNAVIFAYHPYNGLNNNGEGIPIESGLTDYMYGTHTPGQGNINKDNRTVNLTMKHALALVQFNIYKANYPWEGRLTMVNITNAPGKAIVHYSAKMNIQTGEITDLSGSDRNIMTNSAPLLVIPENKFTSETDFVKLLLVPTIKTSSRGEVIITFDIDGKEYKWDIPAGTEWKQGTKYTYDVQLNGNELQIGDVKITDWVEGTYGNVILE